MKNKSLFIGQKYTHEISFTQEEVIKFSEVTNDTNPIHLDEEYASNTIFKRTIVHGFLSGAVFSKVIGTLFPGPGTIYLYQEMKFKRPVFINEKYIAEFEVTQTELPRHKATIYCTLRDSNQDICIEGNAVVMNKERIF